MREVSDVFKKVFANSKIVGSDYEVGKVYHRAKQLGISSPDYEYEMLIDDEGTPFEINSWIPIATDRIKDPSRIDEYIAKGLIRKRQ